MYPTNKLCPPNRKLPKKTIKLKNGNPKNSMVRNVSAQIGRFSQDSIVLISATVVWKKKVGAGDILSCTLGILEGGV